MPRDKPHVSLKLNAKTKNVIELADTDNAESHRPTGRE